MLALSSRIELSAKFGVSAVPASIQPAWLLESQEDAVRAERAAQRGKAKRPNQSQPAASLSQPASASPALPASATPAPLPPLLRERAFRNHQSNRLHPKASTNPSVSNAVLTADSRTAEHSLRQWRGWTSTAMTMNGKTLAPTSAGDRSLLERCRKTTSPTSMIMKNGHEQQPWPAPVRFEVDPNAETQPPAPT